MQEKQTPYSALIPQDFWTFCFCCFSFSFVREDQMFVTCVNSTNSTILTTRNVGKPHIYRCLAPNFMNIVNINSVLLILVIVLGSSPERLQWSHTHVVACDLRWWIQRHRNQWLRGDETTISSENPRVPKTNPTLDFPDVELDVALPWPHLPHVTHLPLKPVPFFPLPFPCCLALLSVG